MFRYVFWDRSFTNESLVLYQFLFFTWNFPGAKIAIIGENESFWEGVSVKNNNTSVTVWGQFWTRKKYLEKYTCVGGFCVMAICILKNRIYLRGGKFQ